MVKLFAIIGKNSKLLSHSKLSALIFLFGPIFLILISGLALKETSIKNINSGIYVGQNTALTDKFIENLKVNSFNTIVYKNLEDCKLDVINANIDICIEIIPYRDETLYDLSLFDIQLYVDFSKQRTVWSIINSVQNVVDQSSDQLRREMINESFIIIDEIEISLNTIEIQIQTTNNIIGDAKSNLKLVEDEIEGLEIKVTSETNKIRNSIQNIRNQNSTYYFNELDYIQDSLIIIDNSVMTLNDDDINNIDNKLSEIRTDLSTINNLINENKAKISEIKKINSDRIANPIILRYNSPSNISSNSEYQLQFIDFLFPSIIMLFCIFSSLIFSTLIVIKERESNAYIRNISNKTNGITIILGNYIYCLILILIQISIILFIGNLFLNISIFSHIYSIFIILFLTISLSIFIGFTIGFIFNSNESAIISSIILSIILFIFSPTISPSEILPKLIGRVVDAIPTTIFESALRRIIVFETGLNIDLAKVISVLISFIIIILILTIFYNVNKRKEL